MTDRLRLFKWRSIARRIAETAPQGSIERDVARQFHDGIDSLFVLRTEDRMLKPKGVQRGGDEHWAWIMLGSDPVARPRTSLYTLEEVTDPVRFPDPTFRVSALLEIFNALMAGLLVVTENVQRVFKRAATNDPDPRVRAWALFLIDPEKNPRPDDE